MKNIQAVSLEAVHTHTHTHTVCLLNCNGTQEKVNKIKNRKKDSEKNLEIGFCCCLFCVYLLLNF